MSNMQRLVIVLVLVAASSAAGQNWRLGIHTSSNGLLYSSGPRAFGVGDDLRAWTPPPATDSVATTLYFKNGQLWEREVSEYVEPVDGMAKSWTLYTFGDTSFSESEIVVGFRTISADALPPTLLDGQQWTFRLTMLNNRGVPGAPTNGALLGEFEVPAQHTTGVSFYTVDPLPAVTVTSRDNILNEAYALKLEQAITTTDRSIQDWKKLEDGTAGRVVGAEVTVDAGDSFYIEAADRSSGIRVSKVSGEATAAGTRATVTGTIETNADGERYILAMGISTAAGNRTILPLGMKGRDVGEGGLSTTGLLIRVWGKPMLTGSPNSFTIEDGSGLTTVVVLPPGQNHGWTAGSIPAYVTVTGASGIKMILSAPSSAVYISDFAVDVQPAVTE